MSATVTDGNEAVTDSGEDQQYFQAIEEVFIRLRGAPLLLSPADWRTAQAWRREGIPLSLVQETLEEIFERRRERGSKDLVSSLRYCKRAVEKAWAETRELSSTADRGTAEALETAPLLQALADRLPVDLPGLEGIRKDILAIDGACQGDPDAAERALANLEDSLLVRLEETLDAERRERVATAQERALEALARRLPEEEIARARLRLHRQLLRDELRLPVFSLFSLPRSSSPS